MNCELVGQNCSVLDSILTSPSQDNAEVVIFGKGVGECILIKSKCGDYIVIDSFINNKTDKPIVLDYLDKFEEDYSKIKVVVISHWHDDHIKGISDIIDAAGNDVKVVINPIIHNDRYTSFLAKQCKKIESDATEFNKTMTLIANKKIEKIIPIVDRNIYFGKKNDIKLIALSPQDSEIGEYIDNILEKLSNINTSYKVKDDNLLSVVILLEIGNESFLLSSDMEKPGWELLINNYKESYYNRSKYYKVPHHGSQTGEHPKIWNLLLKAKPLSFTTLYNRSNIPLEEDIVRITANSKELYIIGEKNKRDKKLESELKKSSFMQDCFVISNKIGIVRVMLNDAGEENIECVGAVYRYSQ